MKIFACLFLLCLGASFSVQSQHIREVQRMMPKMLYVKFPDDAGYQVKDRQLIRPEGLLLPDAVELAGLGYWSKIHHLSDVQLQDLRQQAEKRLQKKVMDFNAAFHFHLYDAAQLERVKAILLKTKMVEKVLTIPVPVNAIAPDLTAAQSYGTSVPSGINADSAKLVYGTTGSGMKICDIEYSYNAAHYDLPYVMNIGKPAWDPFNDQNHGTAAMGIMASKDDKEGTMGIAPDCQLLFVPACTLPDSSYDVQTAVLDVLPHLTIGDIILLEQQIGGPNYDTLGTGQFGLVPVEWFEPYYNVIHFASALGFVVVEAAGNGEQNLDGPEYNTGNDGHYPFTAGKNSGAIIVGAGGVGGALMGTDSSRARLWYSNYGTRVDLQASGERVTTTGYGLAYAAEGVNKYYTYSFGGTSAASPIIAGGIALLQAVCRDKQGAPLLPEHIKRLLKSTGKQQNNGIFPAGAYHIGPVPDIYAAITKALTATSVPVTAQEPRSTVFPNPATGNFCIDLNGHRGNVSVAISNIAGHRVRELNVKDGIAAVHIQLQDQPAGIYSVQLVSECGKETIKLMLQP